MNSHIFEWGVSNNKAGCQMNYFSAIAYHLFGNIFDIPAGTVATIRIPHNFYRLIFRIHCKSTHPFFHGSKAFSASTGFVASANHYSYFFYCWYNKITSPTWHPICAAITGHLASNKKKIGRFASDRVSKFPCPLLMIMSAS